MAEQDQSDVVVIGGGIAGLIAANRAAQLGLRAIVLEQGTAEKYLCNTRYTGGHDAHRSPRDHARRRDAQAQDPRELTRAS